MYDQNIDPSDNDERLSSKTCGQENNRNYLKKTNSYKKQGPKGSLLFQLFNIKETPTILIELSTV